MPCSHLCVGRVPRTCSDGSMPVGHAEIRSCRSLDTCREVVAEGNEPSDISRAHEIPLSRWSDWADSGGDLLLVSRRPIQSAVHRASVR